MRPIIGMSGTGSEVDWEWREDPVSDARGKTRLSSVISPDHAAEATTEVLQLLIPT